MGFIHRENQKFMGKKELRSEARMKLKEAKRIYEENIARAKRDYKIIVNEILSNYKMDLHTIKD